jgi:hypothetical protein
LIDTLIFDPSRLHQYCSDNKSEYHTLFAPSTRIICAIFMSVAHSHHQNSIGFVFANKKNTPTWLIHLRLKPQPPIPMPHPPPPPQHPRPRMKHLRPLVSLFFTPDFTFNCL